MLRLVNSIAEYTALTERYSENKLFSNDYIQSSVDTIIGSQSLYEMHSEANLFLFVKKNVGYRLYYYVSDTSDIIDISDINNVVVEIIYRGDRFYPQEEIDYLLKCGFCINLIRDAYCGVYKDLKISDITTDISVRSATNLDQVKTASILFNNSFDHLSGDYIVESENSSLLHNQQIYIAEDCCGNFMGAIHQTIDRGVAWVSHVAVLPEARGRGVGKTLVVDFIRRNCTTEKQRYMLWVQRDNKAAVSMYENIGFKYINKSTISLIKL